MVSVSIIIYITIWAIYLASYHRIVPHVKRHTEQQMHQALDELNIWWIRHYVKEFGNEITTSKTNTSKYKSNIGCTSSYKSHICTSFRDHMHLYSNGIDTVLWSSIIAQNKCNYHLIENKITRASIVQLLYHDIQFEVPCLIQNEYNTRTAKYP